MRKSRREQSKRTSSRSSKSRKIERDIPSRSLRPVRSIIVIDSNAPSEIPAQSINAGNVGLKAFGLASMPEEWVPPFFVISASCFSGSRPKRRVQKLITDVASATFQNRGPVIIRSSGSSETAGARGQLVSKQCLSEKITETIGELIKALPSEARQPVHWIAQQVIPAQQLGHLSNERHLRKEHRDWIVEVETFRGRPGYTISFAIRRWRDGMEVPNLDLACTSELAISRKLRRVAMWAMAFSTRLHFEWVWDGRRIWMVQADPADLQSGIDPAAVIPRHLPRIHVDELKRFRLADKKDYEILVIKCPISTFWTIPKKSNRS
jgi:hypothetical protein